MSIPDYQTLMLPLLKLVADGKERKFRDAVEDLALQFKLTSEERAEMLPSGTAPVFDNRVEKWSRKSEQRYKWKLRAQCRTETGLATRSF